MIEEFLKWFIGPNEWGFGIFVMVLGALVAAIVTIIFCVEKKLKGPK